MKINLSIKILSTFFLILAIVAGAFALSRYLFSQQFRNFIYQEEMAALYRLVPVLQDYYRKQGGWQDIEDHRLFLERMTRKAEFPYDFDRSADGPTMNPQPPGDTPPSPPGDTPPSPPGDTPPSPPGASLPKPPGDGAPSPPDDKHRPRRMHNVFLMDAEFHIISGMKKPYNKDALKAIRVNGEIVGWLGLHKPEHLDPGPADAFMKQHVKQQYVLTGIVIGLTGLIAILLSRHLLKPINRLIRGTQELAGRNFNVRLRITTRDELGLLADHFNSMARTLENYENMRRQWLTDISHELRTPMTVLRGEIEALYDGMREPTQQNLASLKSEILRLARLIDDLHMLSVADADSLNLENKLISPQNVLEETLASYEARLRQRRISVSPVQGSSVIRIYGDESRLSQVFANILENVCNYVMSPGALKITEDYENNYWVLCFHDSGPGVPDEALDRLFDRLYRVDASRSRNRGGSGLGLSICQRIIELHGGNMWAEKSPMGGLLIGIKIPLAEKRF